MLISLLHSEIKKYLWNEFIPFQNIYSTILIIQLKSKYELIFNLSFLLLGEQKVEFIRKKDSHRFLPIPK